MVTSNYFRLFEVVVDYFLFVFFVVVYCLFVVDEAGDVLFR